MSEKKIYVSGDLSSDDKFKAEMLRIERKGFIRSRRSGDTGIGKTLEDELGIQENSVQAADLGKVELKAARKGSNSDITLITKAPDKRGVNRRVLRERYGYQTEESRALNPDLKILHTTVTGRGFNTLNGELFLKLTEQGDRMYLQHAIDGILEEVYWSKQQLKQAYIKKYPINKFYLVRAETKRDEDGAETFHYIEAYSYEGFSPDGVIAGLMSGTLEMDIRLGIYGSGKNAGKAHDNGTAIRVKPSNLEICFENKIIFL